ncbi:MAG TPA: hypothetical protein VFN46_10065 [Acetobacteraceae bacterium]|nr:hypothetical protein [Acetobacteraceae bacterium]
MPDANTATAEKAPAQKLITELKVSGHLMTLDTGLFCIVQTPSRALDVAAGLPGVRVSLPPGPMSRPEAVTISTFRPDGWLLGGGDAALVRVLNGPAQILVTIYQAPNAAEGAAPSLQVLRLLEPIAGAPPAGRPAPPAVAAAPAPAQPQAPAPARGPQRVMEMVAHIQERGDVGAMLGEWMGERGSKKWIEGFGISPTHEITPADIEYQAVLGRGWLSPWVEGGQYCGSRGMALPILGLRLRLRGQAAETHEAFISATFLDGSAAGPVPAGEACEAPSLAPIEAFQVVIRRRATAAAPAAPAAAVAAAPSAGEAKAPARKAAAKPKKPAEAPKRR